jgi:pimeloyl-ACP methyl ester carboxylesterase
MPRQPETALVATASAPSVLSLNASDTPDEASRQRIEKTAAAIDLAGHLFDQATTRIHEFHRAISDKPIAAVNAVLGPAAAPVTVAHNAITDLVYGSVRLIGRSLLKAGAIGMNASAGVVNFTPSSPGYDKGLDAVASAASGLVGDQLAATGSALAPELGFYVNRQRLELDAGSLVLTYPDAKSHLVVFVHGLCCNEDCWWMYAEQNNGQSYGDFLDQGGGRTALYVRYNTGLKIAANGKRLKRELERLVKHWPVPVQRITLVGHSMGGLVSRVVVDESLKTNTGLAGKISDLVCLGSPHEGAPLARLSAKGETLLDAFDMSRPVSKVLGVRSRGVRNLEAGLGATPVTRYENIRVHLVGSTVGTFEQPRLADTIGDGLVQISSALAADALPQGTRAHENMHHMNLLNDAKIRQQLDDLTRTA